MTESIIAGAAVAAAVGFALWRPAIAVMALGVFLFIQSALVRTGALSDQLTTMVGRADEVVLAALLLRSLVVWLVTGKPRWPLALWAMAVFGVIGIISAFVNGINPLATGLGLFLAMKAALWLFVGLSLDIDLRVLARYSYLIGALFVGVVAIAALQIVGVPLPWRPYTRAGVIAATSIWNFHTAFGGAMSVGVGLSVAALRLPTERLAAAVLGFSSVVGVLLSTARRLLVSLLVGAVAALAALPSDARSELRAKAGLLRRPAILGTVVVVLAIGAVTVGPRLVNLAQLTWERYVVELPKRDRFQLYEGAFRLVVESPLVGRGPATFGSFASVVVESPAYEEVGYQRPRSSMVVGGQIASVLAEYGILGFTAFAAFLVLLTRALIPIARGRSGSVPAALATGGIFMMANMIVESTVNPVFSNSFITFFTFVGIGISLKLNELAQDGSELAAWEPGGYGKWWRTTSIVGAGLILLVLAGALSLVTSA